MSERIPFATDAWVKRLCEELNKSERYREAAKKWEGDLYFIIEPEGRLTEKVFMYMDLWHGECRQAFVAEDENAVSPAFRMWAPVSIWKRIIDGKLDPMQALLTRQLKMKGNMAKIMRNVKAAQELVRCATMIPTEFPID
ncbi:MAG TPA: hypothetical protein ENK56_02975 [Chloroflexi bacterium]|nr:hypothetical protein [Chloroflexota bacterium]